MIDPTGVQSVVLVRINRTQKTITRTTANGRNPLHGVPCCRAAMGPDSVWPWLLSVVILLLAPASALAPPSELAAKPGTDSEKGKLRVALLFASTKPLPRWPTGGGGGSGGSGGGGGGGGDSDFEAGDVQTDMHRDPRARSGERLSENWAELSSAVDHYFETNWNVTR